MIIGDLLSTAAFRSVILLISTTFSILFVMLLLNIVTVDEVVTILKLSPEAANAFKLIVSRIQEVSSSVIDILSKLLTKLFSWAGLEVDLSKIHVDVGQTGSATTPVVPVSDAPAGN